MWITVLVMDDARIESASHFPESDVEETVYRLVEGAQELSITRAEMEQLVRAPRWLRRGLVSTRLHGARAAWATSSAYTAL